MSTSTKPYRIYRKLLMPKPTTLKAMKSLVMKDGVNIFNPDEKRYQVVLNNSEVKEDIIRALRAKTNELEGRYAGGFFALCSLKGCKQQPWHYDFDPKLLQNLEIKPCGVLWAIQGETKLSILGEASDLILGKGDVVVFDGDLVHAGSHYNKMNTRIHCYLEVPGVARQVNTTWYYQNPSTTINIQ